MGQFLNEEIIAQQVQGALTGQLQERGGCRLFNTQSLAPAPMPGGLAGSGTTATTTTTATVHEDVRSATRVNDSALIAGASGDLGRARPSELRPEPPQTRIITNKQEPLNPTRVRTDSRQRSLESMWRDSRPPAAVTQAGAQPSIEEAERGIQE